MTRTEPTVRFCRRSELEDATALLVEAFLVSPVGDWLIQDVGVRRTVYEEYFALQVDRAHEYGRIRVAPDHDGLSGVAVWFERTPPPDDYDKRLSAACGPWLRRFQLLDEVLDRRHPTGLHHYLAFLGVRPDRQRRGIGSALLAPHHAWLDDLAVPAYLEASTEGSRDLYLRHGYVLTDSEPLWLPEDGPPLWPMWREPRGRGPAG
jgi:GNAT superfamily N-acetyltransferase